MLPSISVMRSTNGFEAGSIACREVVDDADLVARRQQATHEMVADEAAALP